MSKTKSEQLGMPHGTAAGQLRKNVLFHLVQRLNEDVCFRCGLKIEDARSLSIEHKTPWQNNDVSLFWDLENIAFSHLSCNSSFVNRSNSTKASGRAKRKIGPNGERWCNKCKSFLPEEMFGVNNSHWSGRQVRCKTCKNER